MKVTSVIPPDNHIGSAVSCNDQNNEDQLCPRLEDQSYPQGGITRWLVFRNLRRVFRFHSRLSNTPCRGRHFLQVLTVYTSTAKRPVSVNTTC